MKITEVRKILKEEFSYAAKNVVVRADGTATVRDYYFYKCGRSLDKLEAAVKKVFPQAEFISRGEEIYDTSKRLWYMQVTFRYPRGE
jgi:hypothetical protein